MTSQAMKQNTKKIIDKKEFFDKYRSLIALALLVVVAVSYTHLPSPRD